MACGDVSILETTLLMSQTALSLVAEDERALYVKHLTLPHIFDLAFS